MIIDKEIKLRLQFTEEYLNFNLRVGTRMSIWQEQNPKYTMPCEVREIEKNKDYYIISLLILDKDNYVDENDTLMMFAIGYPTNILATGKILG